MTKPLFYGLVLALALGLPGYWLFSSGGPEIAFRLPIPENAPRPETPEDEADVNPGTLIPGAGLPSQLSGSWPQFRGRLRDAVARNAAISSPWPDDGPEMLWKVSVGEGHAGAAIHRGRVYLLDYDEDNKEDVVRCLSLDNGEEIWRYTYYVKIKRNHGMSRTVPAVNNRFVVTLGPKCHVYCLDATSGEQIWKKNLVTEYGTKIPEWYAGQCPLIEEDRVILAPGRTSLMTAIDLATGEAIWETPNEDKWDMTWEVGLRMTWTVNDTFETIGRSREVEAQIAQLSAERRVLEDAIRMSVVHAYYDREIARSAIAAAQARLQAGEASLEARRKLFLGGKASSTDMVDAASELTAARVQRLDAHVDLLIAEARLDHTLGVAATTRAP